MSLPMRNRHYIATSLAIIAVSACSSKSPSSGNADVKDDAPANVASDGRSDASTSNPPPGPSDPGSNDAGPPNTLAGCVAACEASHPAGLQLGQAIDACWVASCSPACTDDMVPTGEVYEPKVDGGSCGHVVKTPGQACSNCTATKCCAAWDGCFGDADCVALNECALDCHGRFGQ